MLIKLEQCRPDIKELEEGIAQLRQSVGADALIQEVKALEEQTNAADFWSTPDEAQRLLRTLKGRKSILDSFLSLENGFNSFYELYNMAIEDDDEDLVDDLLAELSSIK
ncbi:MAG: hypothetical protein IKM53_06660, partial [Clostridia bacterium]|nr:hypothetical protein [Clostridia bacterium]